jgi:hypothetical protein
LSINLFGPVVPPDAFALSDAGATYLRVSRQERPAIGVLRHFDFPAGSWTLGILGAPVFGNDAFRSVVEAARLAVRGGVSRACVTIPDAWARTLTLDFDVLPAGKRERTEMVNWKIKKLLPGRVEDLEVTFSEIPKTGEGVRLLVSAAPRDTIRSVESAFAAVGVRIGLLSTSTLAFFDGFDDRLSRSAGGDYLLLHRSGKTSSLLIARNGHPLFYRQKSASEEGTDDAQEVRLSLSYYTEALGGAQAPALFLWDEPHASGVDGSESLDSLPFRPINAALLLADSSLDLHARAHPESLAAAAAALETN